MALRFARHLRVTPALTVGLACTLAAGAAAARGGGCPCGTLADEFRAADAGLVREWIVQVPFDSAAWRLEHVVVGDDLVLVQSGDGGVHAIRSSGTAGDRTGTLAWSRPMPAAAGHSWPPTAGSRLVVVTGDQAVHALDPETGAVEWERTTGALTAAAAMQSGGWVYVPLETHRILRLPADPFGRADDDRPAAPPRAAEDRDRPPAEPRAPRENPDPLLIDAGGHLDDSPVAWGGGAIWGTDSGLVALEPTRTRWIRHHFPETAASSQARQPRITLRGPPVVHRDGIFVVTEDGMLARILLDAPTHRGLWAAWTTPLPDRPASGPLVSGDTVIVSLGPSGIAAFAVADGSDRWRSDIVGTVVAVAGGRVWVLDETGRLTALDLASGFRRHSWCIGCFTLPVVSTVAERIVLASPSGLVVSLAPPAPPDAAPPVNAADRPEAEPEPVDPDATPR